MRAKTTRRILPLAALAACLGITPAAAAEEISRVDRAALPADPSRLLVEVAGAEKIAAADLEVVENGQPRSIIDLEAVAEEWRVVLYFDQLLTDDLAFRNAAVDLADRARDLTALGTVEIVLAGESLRTALPGTREPAALSEALSWLRLRESAAGEQIGLREDFIELLEGDDAVAEEVSEGRKIADLAAEARQATREEAEMIRAFRERLLAFTLERDSHEPKVLFLVSGGHDADPAQFYRAVLEGTPFAAAGDGLSTPTVAPSAEETAQALSAYGWLVMPVSPTQLGDALLNPDPAAPPKQHGEDLVETVFEGGRVVEKTTVPGFDLSKLGKRKKGDDDSEALVAALLSPLAPLEGLATATGGELIQDAESLMLALGRLPRRQWLRFEPGAGARGEIRSVEVKLSGEARSGRGGEPVIRARGWTADATPESMSALRARRFLGEKAEEGDLLISAAVRPEAPGVEPSVIVQYDPPEVAAATGEPMPLRVSVAVADPTGEAAVLHHGLDPDGIAERVLAAGGEASLLELPLPAGIDVDAPIVVVLEDLSSGRWGAAFASVADASTSGGIDVLSLGLPAPKVIHLMAPVEGMVMGRTTFETVAAESRVTRVEFFLDGKKVSVGQAPPFAATVDLGKLPETHRLEAVAYGADGAELGRDRLMVNEGAGSFRLRILDPFGGNAPKEIVTGPVEIEAEIRAPRGEQVERVEFFWIDRLVATRYAPPFVQRVTIPEEAPKGFVRVVGHLRDGAVSEDVLFLNSPGSSERLEVDLVQLYVVVTDRKGQPIRGLGQDQFKIFEEGDSQELASFGDAGDQPLTVGLTIDSSASMFIKLPDVQLAAAKFVQGLSERKDRAFVVGFGNEPELQRDTTSDLSRVIDDLYRLEPDGKTAIWKAIVYSLVQLQGAGGKKALIVYSDGADDDPEFSYRTCLEFARRVGVPIYVIISNNEIERTGGKSLTVKGFLGRLDNLVSEVGGRVFLTRVDDDLSDIYQQIDEELRSQYVVGYYVQEAGGNRWRRVKVDVEVPGAKVRTLAGYYR